MAAERAGVKIGTPGAKPDGLEVPGYRELVAAIHSVPQWFPPADAYVRGAVDDDPPGVVRVLVALDRGHSLTAACELAIRGESGKRSEAGHALRMRVLRTGAYGRWLAAVERQLVMANQLRVAGETRAEHERRVAALKKLVAKHRLRRRS